MKTAPPPPFAPSPFAPSYFHHRIHHQLGITPAQNLVQLQFPAIHGLKSWRQTNLFEEDPNGNIKITVFDIEKNIITYKPNPNEKEYYDRQKPYQITRLQTPETYIDKEGKAQTRKYILPKGAGTYPYFPYQLCEKYANAQKIQTLILTEGYLKAAKGAQCGIDVIGFSSITHNKDKETQTMYADVLKILWKCNVENIIILFDGDCRQISTKDLQAGRDLIRRPKTFFTQICKCRELLADHKKNIYFATIKTEDLPNNPKGLDDLLLSIETQNPSNPFAPSSLPPSPFPPSDIAADLLALSRPSKYFTKFDITYETRHLYKWFRLSKVEQFYDFHQPAIADQKFIFSGTQYQYNPEKEELTVIIPADAKNYARVGDGYYEFVHVPNKYKQLEKQLHQRNKETIRDDYGKDFFEHIPKYKAFCNVPDHIHYQPIIENCFNRYYEFEHEPQEGDCPLTLDFIQHIFGEQHELGLDYIQLLYKRPQQILPILCLVSAENNTGKSTFIKWLKAIFTNNCTIIGNAELSNDFNSGWATRLIIACEESFIDKKPVIERIKALSTGDKIVINQKGKDHVEVDFFGKFILASNNEDSFIIAGKKDIRYWVRKIPVPPTDKIDMLAAMIQEIPQFLHLLNRRQMHTRQNSRMWFAPHEIHTEALTRLIEQNLPKVIKEIREKVRQYFFDFQEAELQITAKQIAEHMLSNRYDSYYIIRECKTHLDIDFLRDEKGNRKIKRCTYKWKTYITTNEITAADNFTIHTEKQIGQPLVFQRQDFLTPHEIQTLTPPTPEPHPLQEETPF